MANYAQTVNVIGAIKTTATAAEMEATGLALALYRRHFGTLPVKVEGRARAARRGGGVDGRPLGPDRGGRQSHVASRVGCGSTSPGPRSRAGRGGSS